MLRRNIKKMLENFCCSECKSDFDENSIKIIRQEGDLFVINIICQSCGKDFGLSFLSLKESDSDILKQVAFEIEPCPDTISSNDVIDAHNFIKELNEDWQKFILDRHQNK